MIQHIKAFASRFFIFGSLKRPIIPFKVNLLYWRPKKGDNVGDYLSKVVFDWCIEHFNLCNAPTLKTKRLSVIGSVLSFIGGGKNTVWGTGILDSTAISAILNPAKKVKLDIRAVRGPLTRKALIDGGVSCPEVFEDPAILMPLIYPAKRQIKKGKVVIIPHESRYLKYASKYTNVLNTYTRDYKGFINEILSAEKVVSSSLHGIILAEAYGVPAIFLNDYPGSRFKYNDYYLSTGRNEYPIANTIEEVYEMNGGENQALVLMQKHLIQSFPKDIFPCRK